MDGVLVKFIPGASGAGFTGLRVAVSERFDNRRTHGRRNVDTITETLPDLTDEPMEGHIALSDSFAEQKMSGVEAYLGVVDLLASIPPYWWTVVTSASTQMMRTRLPAVGFTVPATQ